MPKAILNTRNYGLFETSSRENRPLDIKKHRKLEESMKKYGFLEEFPIIVFRNGNGKLIVKEGQHRLAIAQKLSLPVYYVESKTDINVPEINGTSVNWGIEDYAMRHRANNIKSYEEGMEFAEQHGLPIGTAFALLAGVVGYTSISEQFKSGTFKVKDRAWADAVANIYVPLTKMSKDVRHNKMLEACMAVCRVPEFDANRLLRCAERCRDKLVAYSTRDAYLDMLEDIYNFHHSKLLGLKVAATMALRERSAVKSKKNGNGKHPTD